MTEQELIHIGDLIYSEIEINPSKIGVSSRQINYWISEGLIPFASSVANNQKDKKSNKGKWVRLNASHAVWACLIQELFKLNVSKKSVQDIAEDIWQKSREEKYADKVFKRHIEKNPLKLSKQSIEQLEHILQDEMLMEYYYRTIINPFTDLIKSAFTKKDLPYSFIYVPDTGEHGFRYNGNDLLIDLNSLYLQHTVISIPFLPILSRIINTEFSDRKKKDLNYLNEIEKQIRDIVVFKKPKVVEIAFEEDSIKTIVVTEEHKSREKLAEYILLNKIKKGSKLLIDIRSNDNYKITLIKKEESLNTLK